MVGVAARSAQAEVHPVEVPLAAVTLPGGFSRGSYSGGGSYGSSSSSSSGQNRGLFGSSNASYEVNGGSSGSPAPSLSYKNLLSHDTKYGKLWCDTRSLSRRPARR